MGKARAVRGDLHANAASVSGASRPVNIILAGFHHIPPDDANHLITLPQAAYESKPRGCDATVPTMARFGVVPGRESTSPGTPIVQSTGQLGAVWAQGRGADPKGGDWERWPEDLRVRQFPPSNVTSVRGAAS